jgi:SSS family solute:Na+ symporter
MAVSGTLILMWTVFAAYLVFLAVAGIRAGKKTHNFEDFMVAGRKIGPLLLGLSFGVTYFSAVMIVGGGEYSYAWGLGAIWVAVIDCLVGVFAIFIFFGKRTMKLSEVTGSLTVPELLGKRYKSKGVQMFTALVCLFFETVYLVSIYMGLSLLLKYAMPGMDANVAYTIAVVICGIITMLYLNIGGAHGTITTDIVESIIMLAGVAAIFIAGMTKVGGIDGLVTGLQNIAISQGKPADVYTTFPGAGGFGIIGYILVTAFGVWGMPQMISRYFTVNKKKDIRGGLLISVLWALLVALLAWWNGAIGRVLQVEGAVGAAPPAEIIPALVNALLHPVLVSVFMAAILAASLTTGEKVIMVASGAFSRDFYQLVTGCSDEKAMKLTKVLNMVVITAGIIMALTKPDAVLALCMFAWSAMAATILIPYVVGLFWKGGTAKAVIISGAMALFAALFWKMGVVGMGSSPAFAVFPFLKNVMVMQGGVEVALPNYVLVQDFYGSKILLKGIHEFIVSQVVAIISYPIASLLTKKDIDKAYVDDLFAKMKS